MDLTPMKYMHFDAKPVTNNNVRVTPLMSNPGVYEMHTTDRFNNYGQCIDSHISCKDASNNLMWRHTLHK